MSKKSNKIPRKLLTATMSCVFMISLSSCSGARNNYGNLEKDAVYASSGNQTVTNKELWNELKWDASSKLEQQINNVVLYDQLDKISLVMDKKDNYDTLTNEEKEKFENQEQFNHLAEQYSNRLIDYVVQDIYNFSFKSESYWEDLEEVTEIDKKRLEAKYIDELYVNYRVSKIGEADIEDLILNASEEQPDNYLTIAKGIPTLYYPLLAKEVLAEEKLLEEADEANEKDKDAEDDNLGYFTNTDYISKFKTEYANQHNLNLILIRFATQDEYEDTLRAFGIKVYNKKFYYVNGVDPETNTERSYSDYCDYYDDLSNSKLTLENEEIDHNRMIEIFIQIYNYLYNGYRTTLTGGLTDLPSVNKLEDLRAVTREIVNAGDLENITPNAIAALKQNNLEQTTFNKEDLDKISSSFSTYLYESLDLEKIPFSTSTQAYNSSYYIAYKFAEDTPISDLYNKELTDDEIIEIITKDENKEIKDSLYHLLIKDRLTDTTINSYVEEETDKVKVKIYNEAMEITYSTSHTDYSKTISKNKNKNVLATLEYKKKKWNFNLMADDKDKNSLVIAGSKEKYGAFNELEKESGQTTAIDILSKKIIKTTDAYTKTNEDRDFFNNYIEAILFNFANEGYSASGYPSSIGKYNFLMLYFHSADIDFIIDDYYRVQFASTELLTDYSSDKLISFIKNYTDKSYDNYFSLQGSRLVVSFDGNDDTEADDVKDWKEKIVTLEGTEVTLEKAAKSLLYDFYKEVNASTDEHETKLNDLVEEFNDSARVAFDENPILAENQWAKYRKVGLKVSMEEFTATNTSTDIDFNLKQRLFDYARGFGDNGEVYQYFINNTTPTSYIEPITPDCVNEEDTQWVETKDGYNLILVDQGETHPSAKWEKEDHDEDLLQNITLKYNEEYITIGDIYNEEDKLNDNQIKLYLLEYISSNTNTLIPTTISSACTTFLSPVITRFTGEETQRQILLEYITNQSGAIQFTTDADNQNLQKILEIDQRTADDYNELYGDTTKTSNSFPDWWTELSAYLKGAK